ncbi:hypothetical protein EVAR_30537_1 [Eumeta japonica]|uniref:Uncharacterized protein n=1 Tax=Eumeta variegata TaxID=151549 RepID=A0A4C1VQL1_EUMVA|nr:hypothetical protein EVAR_30537_1 [Eumeta japonica]
MEFLALHLNYNKSWTWQRKYENSINAVEIRTLHTMCGVSVKDRCENSNTRERYGLKENVVDRGQKEFVSPALVFPLPPTSTKFLAPVLL